MVAIKIIKGNGVFLERGITKMPCKRKEPEKHRDGAVKNKKC